LFIRAYQKYNIATEGTSPALSSSETTTDATLIDVAVRTITAKVRRGLEAVFKIASYTYAMSALPPKADIAERDWRVR
jgi:hypothetical protein